MSQCRVCTGRAELFICPQCTQELRAHLGALAQGPEANGRKTNGLLDALADVVLKYTRLKSSSGHRKRGDEMPALFIPDVGKMDKDNRPILSPQGLAAVLLDDAHNKLTTIIRDLCETRGVPVMVAFQVVPADFIGPLLPGRKRAVGEWKPTNAEQAQWLADNVHAIACDESAAHWWTEIDQLVRTIERLVDKPEPLRFCGPCPTYIEDLRDNCGKLLYAQRSRYIGGKPQAVTEVRCSACKATHSIQTLITRLENRADTLRFTSSEILTVMQTLETPIPERTWQRWRKENRVKIRGYKRPDNPDGTRGRVGDYRRNDDDEPVYRLSEVRAVFRTSIRHADAQVRQITRV